MYCGVNDFFSITRGSGATLRTDTISFSNLDARKVRNTRISDTIEAIINSTRETRSFGYRYAKRRIDESFSGFNLGSNGSLTPPPARTTEANQKKTTP